jgi:hypothetical protein
MSMMALAVFVHLRIVLLKELRWGAFQASNQRVRLSPRTPEKPWISDDSFEAFVTVVTRSHPIPRKRMGIRHEEPYAEIRVSCRGVLKRHLSVVFRHIRENV